MRETYFHSKRQARAEAQNVAMRNLDRLYIERDKLLEKLAMNQDSIKSERKKLEIDGNQD